MTRLQAVDTVALAFFISFLALFFGALVTPFRRRRLWTGLLVAAAAVAAAGMAWSVRAEDDVAGMLLQREYGKPPPAEVWLTKERAEQLRQITARPYVTKKDGDVLHWTNGVREWVTTNTPRPMVGKRTGNGWQNRIERAEKDRDEIVAAVKALKAKGKATAKELDAIVEKHDKK